MAILRSLGKQTPTGLTYLVTEGLLPEDPPQTSYEWTVYGEEHRCRPEEELVSTAECVVWSRGGFICRVFNFTHEGEKVQHAVLTWFPTATRSRQLVSNSRGAESGHSDKDPHNAAQNDCSDAAADTEQSRALVVLLQHQAQVFFLDGNTHTVNVPFEVDRVFPAPKGILLQRKVSTVQESPPAPPAPFSAPPNSFWSSQNQQSSQPLPNPLAHLFRPSRSVATSRGSFSVVSAPHSDRTSSHELPTLFTLTDPVSELGLVVEGVESLTSSTATRLEPVSQDEKVLYVTPVNEIHDLNDDDTVPLLLVFTANRESQTYSLWHASYASAVTLAKQAVPSTAPSTTPLHRAKKRRSYAARMSTGAGTPALRGSDVQREAVHPRQGPLSFDGKVSARQRLSDSFMLDQEYDADFPAHDDFDLMNKPGHNTRSTRRTSSMLARAELSGQEQQSFSEMARLPPGANNSFGRYSRRPPSFGYGSLTRSRLSGRASSPTSTSFLSDVDESLNQGPTSVDFLEGLLASAHLEASDRASFRSVKGLKKELVMVRALSVPFERASIPIANAMPPPEDRTRVTVLGPTFGIHKSRNPMLRVWITNGKHSSPVELVVPVSRVNVANPDDMRAKRIVVPAKPFHIRRHQDSIDVVKIADGDQTRVLVLQNSSSTASLHVLAGPDGSAMEAHSQKSALSIELQLPSLLTSNSSVIRATFFQHDQNHPQQQEASLASFSQNGSSGCFTVDDARFGHNKMQLPLRPRNPLATHILAILQRSFASTEHTCIDVHALWLQVVSSIFTTGVVDEWMTILITITLLILCLLGEHRVAAINGIESSIEQERLAGTQGMASVLQGFELWSWCVDEMTSPQQHQTQSRAPDVWIGCWSNAQAILSWSAKRADSFLYPIIASQPEPEALLHLVIAMYLVLEEQRLRLFATTNSEQTLSVKRLLLQLAYWLNLKTLAQHVEQQYNVVPHIDRTVFVTLRQPLPPAQWIDAQKDILSFREDSMRAIKSLNMLLDDATIRSVDGLSYNSRSQTQTLFETISALHTHVNGDMVYALACAPSGGHILETLPPTLTLDVWDALLSNRENPPTIWSSKALSFVGRDDLKLLFDPSLRRIETEPEDIAGDVRRRPKDVQSLSHIEDHQKDVAHSPAASSESLLRHIFRDDRRWSEAARLVDPARVATAAAKPAPGQTEAAFLEAQKEVAQKVYQRTMALPSGQAVMRYGISRPLMTEKIKVNTFNTTCIMQPSNNSINADKSNFTEEKVGWAFFHAGANAGLQIARDAPGIDTSWLVLNKPTDLGNRHAGLLLGLGLNGHLKKMARWLAFKYLTSKHAMTSVGLLLGLSASNLGTQDSLVTRLISVHVTRLLPPGAAQLNISPLTQTAGIMGVGLLYHNTQHRRMSEVMLSELEATELDDSTPSSEGVKDESYRFAAGCSLGLINLGQGADLRALHDMSITQRLLTIATGPRQISSVHVLDQATAGAVLALAMIYMKTNDHAVAAKIDALAAARQFDTMRPDILLLRTVAKWLILWHDIDPVISWIEGNSINPDPNTANPLDSDNIAAYNIRAGLCWAIALRYAGTADQRAVSVLRHYLQWVKLQLRGAKDESRKHTFDENLTLDTLYRFQQLLALSLATICAGTGDLPVLRELRAMHAEIENKTFGLHTATHMAIGMLFLGHGRYTFGTSHFAVASLLISLYPVFPRDVQDGRAHLQALRHFWCLAAEERCLIPRDSETKAPIVVPIVITLRPEVAQAATPSRRRRGKRVKTQKTALERQAPCHIPPLDQILRIRTVSPEHFPVTLDFANNSEHVAAFRRHQSVFLQLKPLSGQFKGIFGANLAQSEQIEEDKNDTAKAVEWVFTLPSFRQMGVDGFAQGVVKLAMGGEKNGQGEAKRPVATLMDLKGTGIDEVMSLRAHAVSGKDRDRLVWLKTLLNQEEERDAKDGNRRLREDWLEAVKCFLVERMKSKETKDEDRREDSTIIE